MKPTLVLLLVLCTTAAEYPREQKTDAEQHRAAHYRELDRWLQGQLANAPAERSLYWKQDFSSPSAYERSIASYRADWERMLGVPPLHRGPFREKRVAVGETAKLTIERVWIEVWPGVQAYGILITPKGAKRAPAVICLHGHGGSPDLSAGIVTPSVYQDFARALAEKGFVTFSPYIVERYSEENEPKQGPEAWGRDILHKKAHMLGMTLVGIEARKLMRVIDWLETLDTVDRSRIGMYGLSKGGQYTLAVAALDPRIRAAVVSGWFNDRARKNLAPGGGPGAGGMHFITHVHRSEYYFWNLLKQFSDAELGWLIAPRALLIENGDRDGAVLIEDARAEFARVEQVYRRLGLEQKAVFAGFSGGHKVDGRESYPFLNRWLKEAK